MSESSSNFIVSVKSFNTVKIEWQDCNKLPERVKEILNSADNSISDLNENDFNQIWILLHAFLQETFAIEDITQNEELLTSYQHILNLAHHIIYSFKGTTHVFDYTQLLKTILVLQSLYSKNINHTLKLNIVQICLSLWRLVSISRVKDNSSLDFDTVMTENFQSTMIYLFGAIKMTTQRSDMKALSSLLKDFYKLANLRSNRTNTMNLFIYNLQNVMKYTMFLETDAGKITIAHAFSTSQQLFLKFHHNVKNILPKANKLEADAYGDIYFMSWINSNTSMREVIEQRGIFELISKTLTLQRKGLAFRTYQNALILLKSIQKHRKHLIFSRVMTNLYAPILWRQLESEVNMVRCNAVEMLSNAYPLEKIGERRDVISYFLLKQQNAIIDLLSDPCPQVRIAAIKGICRSIRYFWDTFEVDQINKCFTLLTQLACESVLEIRITIFYGFCQLLDESKSHHYFMAPFFVTSVKNTLYAENEIVRRVFIQFLLKIKKVDSQSENTKRIRFAQILDLNDSACALAREEEQNVLLLVDLIIDNFIGERVPDRHITLIRFTQFYKINPTAFRKLLIHSKKHIDFNNAYLLIQTLLNTLKYTLIKKEEENNISENECKTSDNSDNTNYTDVTRNSSLCLSVSNNDDKEHYEHTNICCILDSINCLVILHLNTFIDEDNHQKLKIIQDSCTSCLIKIPKLYKESDVCFSSMCLGSLIPESKSLNSTALHNLRKLHYDIHIIQADDKIDMCKVDYLVYTLCMWNRGHEIIQFVNICIDKVFKTLNFLSISYPESENKEKMNRFTGNIENFKPMTGIVLINSMLINLETQKILMITNKCNVFNLISNLQHIKLVIEKRILTDDVINNFLSDEEITELFLLRIRLHIIYFSHEESSNVEEIIKYQTTILDWIIVFVFNIHINSIKSGVKCVSKNNNNENYFRNCYIHNLNSKNETTIIFFAKILKIINHIVSNICLMGYANKTYLETFFTFCTTVLHSPLGVWVLSSTTSAMINISKHYNYLKQIDTPIEDTTLLINCVSCIISVLSVSKLNEERFKSVIGQPPIFREILTMLILEVYKIGKKEFIQVFMLLIKKIMILIAIQIQQIDLNEELIKTPYVAYQLVMVISRNGLLRNHFSSNAVEIFSSHIYKNDLVNLLSAITFFHTLSTQLNPTNAIGFEPAIRLLYKSLMEHGKYTQSLGIYCTINKSEANQGVPISETLKKYNEELNLKKKGRDILIATARKLRITLV